MTKDDLKKWVDGRIDRYFRDDEATTVYVILRQASTHHFMITEELSNNTSTGERKKLAIFILKKSIESQEGNEIILENTPLEYDS